MSSDDEDEGFAEFADEFEQHTKAIYQLVADYMDDLEIPEAVIAEVLLHMAVNMRMVAYAMEAEKPSVAGLKIDLDRLRGEHGPARARIEERRRGASSLRRSRRLPTPRRRPRRNSFFIRAAGAADAAPHRSPHR